MGSNRLALHRNSIFVCTRRHLEVTKEDGEVRSRLLWTGMVEGGLNRQISFRPVDVEGLKFCYRRRGVELRVISMLYNILFWSVGVSVILAAKW